MAPLEIDELKRKGVGLPLTNSDDYTDAMRSSADDQNCDADTEGAVHAAADSPTTTSSFSPKRSRSSRPTTFRSAIVS